MCAVRSSAKSIFIYLFFSFLYVIWHKKIEIKIKSSVKYFTSSNRHSLMLLLLLLLLLILLPWSFLLFGLVLLLFFCRCETFCYFESFLVFCLLLTKTLICFFFQFYLLFSGFFFVFSFSIIHFFKGYAMHHVHYKGHSKHLFSHVLFYLMMMTCY